MFPVRVFVGEFVYFGHYLKNVSRCQTGMVNKNVKQ
jgi:hypothetical protein